MQTWYDIDSRFPQDQYPFLAETQEIAGPSLCHASVRHCRSLNAVHSSHEAFPILHNIFPWTFFCFPIPAIFLITAVMGNPRWDLDCIRKCARGWNYVIFSQQGIKAAINRKVLKSLWGPLNHRISGSESRMESRLQPAWWGQSWEALTCL